MRTSIVISCKKACKNTEHLKYSELFNLDRLIRFCCVRFDKVNPRLRCHPEVPLIRPFQTKVFSDQTKVR